MENKNKRRVGFYGGKFVPIPHLGHVYAMIKASTLVDELHVIIMYDEEYERKELYKDSKVEFITYKLRLRWWKQITKDMNNVYVHAIYDEQTNSFSDWENGAKKVKEIIGKEIDAVFSSEIDYTTFFSRLYPTAEHILIDYRRKNYNISGTKIRQDGILKHWGMIPKEVRPYFVKQVVLVGTESSGKSTLVKNLAKLYDTNYIEEIGRTYYERLGSYETLESDFQEIAYEHQYKVKKGLEQSNKILFIDTESIVTQNFSIGYENVRQPILDAVSKTQDYDLWLFLEPDVEWVDDGTRIFGEDNLRDTMTQKLKSLLKENNIEYKRIKGSYEQRLEDSIKHIKELIN